MSIFVLSLVESIEIVKSGDAPSPPAGMLYLQFESKPRERDASLPAAFTHYVYTLYQAGLGHSPNCGNAYGVSRPRPLAGISPRRRFFGCEPLPRFSLRRWLRSASLR